MKIPVFDGGTEFEAHAEELREAAERFLRLGRYIFGPEVEVFEQEVVSYVGTQHAVGCASGTDALWLALKAARVGPGDGVIAPAFTFFATASAILNIGATRACTEVQSLPTFLSLTNDEIAVVKSALTSAAKTRTVVSRQ